MMVRARSRRQREGARRSPPGPFVISDEVCQVEVSDWLVVVLEVAAPKRS